MTIQDIADNVCDKYKIKHVTIFVQATPLKQGLASYNTYRIKRNGKINPVNHVQCIEIGNFCVGRVPILELAHELAHHVLNTRSNSLAHSSKHGQLEDEIGLYISRMVKNG